MKHIGNLLLVVLMLSLIMAAGGCGAKFELSSFEISPEVCLAGETVTVSATLTYNGNVEGEYQAELLVDDVVEETKTLTVQPESSQSLSFTLTRDEHGSYAVQLGEFTASLTVLEASNFELSPAEVKIEKPVTVSADLRNVAETEVTYHCCLLCQGTEAATQDITLAGGAAEAVTFTLSQDTPGIYEVQLGNLSASFKVLKPAEFTVVSFDIYPNPVKVEGVTAITIDIENTGEVKGSYNASLTVDGAVHETSEVTLAGGATETVTFSLSKDLPGNYNIQFGGQEAILEVIEPERLPTGIILADESFNGIHNLKTHNETSSDMVVILSSVEEPKVPLLALYVQSGDSHSFRGITGGTYILYFAFGECWDNDSKKFLCTASYGRFEDEFLYEPWANVSKIWTFTFGVEVTETSTTWTVGEDEFPGLG